VKDVFGRRRSVELSEKKEKSYYKIAQMEFQHFEQCIHSITIVETKSSDHVAT